MRTRSGPRSFDAVALGNQERGFFVAAVGTVRTGFGLGMRVTRLPLVTEG
jgi:hypothetical protein